SNSSVRRRPPRSTVTRQLRPCAAQHRHLPDIRCMPRRQAPAISVSTKAGVLDSPSVALSTMIWTSRRSTGARSIMASFPYPFHGVGAENSAVAPTEVDRGLDFAPTQGDIDDHRHRPL